MGNKLSEADGYDPEGGFEVIDTPENSYAKESIGGWEEIETSEGDTIVLKMLTIVKFARSLEPTKRSVSKIAAKLFDPLGLLSPVTVLLLMLLQELCTAKHNWDTVISVSNQTVLKK